MPHPRFKNLDPATRERLLEAAAQVFAAEGFDGASLNRIIEAAGISKGGFYYYFDDKADLFGTVVLLAWEAIHPAEPLDLEALQPDTYWPALMQASSELSERAQEKQWMAGIARLIYHPPRAAGVHALVEKQFAQVREVLRKILRRGQQLGVVRSDLREGLLLTMVLAAAEGADRWMVDHWEELDADEVQRYTVELFQILRRMASPPATEGSDDDRHDAS